MSAEEKTVIEMVVEVGDGAGNPTRVFTIPKKVDRKEIQKLINRFYEEGDYELCDDDIITLLEEWFNCKFDYPEEPDFTVSF